MESRRFRQLLRAVGVLTPGQCGTLLRILLGAGEVEVVSALRTE